MSDDRNPLKPESGETTTTSRTGNASKLVNTMVFNRVMMFGVICTQGRLVRQGQNRSHEYHVLRHSKRKYVIVRSPAEKRVRMIKSKAICVPWYPPPSVVRKASAT